MGPILVVCIGNYYGSDDGVGVHVFRRLPYAGLPETVLVREVGLAGLALLDEIAGASAVILVDAVRFGGRPGTVYRLDATQLRQPLRSPLSAHEIGLAEVLAVGREMLGNRMPGEMVLIGVEGAEFNRFGSALSPAVQRAMNRVLCCVAEEALRLSKGKR